MGNDYKNNNNKSLFTPIVLIMVGAFWLLSNMGLLPNINWGSILRLWPLLLIFWGLSLIFRSMPRPFSSLLTALLGLVAVGTFITIALFGETIPFLTPAESVIVSNEVVSVPLDGVQEAEVVIETGQVSAEITTLSNPDLLLDGTISYVGNLTLENKVEDDQSAQVKLDIKSQNGWFLDPSNWNQFDDDDKWELGLTPTIPLDLEIDAKSGGGSFALNQLQLSNLAFDGGSGRLTILLPDGSYDANLDLGSGASSWTLPANGSGDYKFDGGSGAMMLNLPQGMEAQIEVDGGSGAFSADSRFTLVKGDNKDGTWETAGFDSAENRLKIELDIGSGAVAVQLPTGR